MACKCGNGKLVSICGKVSDLCFASYGGVDKEGYCPEGIGVGGGDYIEFEFCPKCMTIQGEPPSEEGLGEAFPRPKEED
jgi:hypothetical protein